MQHNFLNKSYKDYKRIETFAPPAESSYATSKAAIAMAFEGLALNYHNSNLDFSVIYAGPVATGSLKGNLPYTWNSKRMAKYVLKKANKGKSKSSQNYCVNSI